MTDDGTARVRAYEADKQRINDLRQGGETQADVIRRLLEESDGPTEEQRQRLAEDMERIMEETDEWTPLSDVAETPPGYENVNAGITEILDALDRIEDAATTAEERTGSIERTLEGIR